jgi:hypothetical protein
MIDVMQMSFRRRVMFCLLALPFLGAQASSYIMRLAR